MHAVGFKKSTPPRGRGKVKKKKKIKQWKNRGKPKGEFEGDVLKKERFVIAPSHLIGDGSN